MITAALLASGTVLLSVCENFNRHALATAFGSLVGAVADENC